LDNRTFSAEQKLKLTQLINEGMQVMHEVETLNGGLSDTIKAVAEELEVKPSVLKKAIRVAHKAEFGKTQQGQELLETILTLLILYPVWITGCAMYAWAAWSRKSFGMLANYILLTTIDTIGLVRMLT